MLKKFLIGLGVVIALLLVIGVVRLLALRHSIGVNSRYWQQQAAEAAKPARPGELTYVVLGDSIAQAIGASQPRKGYVGQIADQLARQSGKPVRVVNLSVTGARVSDLLATQLPQLSKYEADIITVEIGANNMRSYNHDTFRQQYELFISALPAGKSVVSNMPYFGTRPSVNPHALDANRTIAELAGKYGIPMVDIYGPLKAQTTPFIYAADFFHPNDRGYRIWYEAFSPAVSLIKP